MDSGPSPWPSCSELAAFPFTPILCAPITTSQTLLQQRQLLGREQNWPRPLLTSDHAHSDAPPLGVTWSRVIPREASRDEASFQKGAGIERRPRSRLAEGESGRACALVPLFLIPRLNARLWLTVRIPLSPLRDAGDPLSSGRLDAECAVESV